MHHTLCSCAWVSITLCQYCAGGSSGFLSENETSSFCDLYGTLFKMHALDHYKMTQEIQREKPLMSKLDLNSELSFADKITKKGHFVFYPSPMTCTMFCNKEDG